MATSTRQINEVDLLSSSKEELENLVKLAEELKAQYDLALSEYELIKNERQLFHSGVIILYLVFILIILVITGNIGSKLIEISPQSGIILLSASIASSVISAVYFGIKSKQYQRRLNKIAQTLMQDRQAFKEVIMILRETADTLSEQGHWSVLAKAEFRIRLSRLSLDDDIKKSVSAHF